MASIGDFRNDQRTQKLLLGIAFFALIFPAYFYYAANNAESYSSAGGPVGNYSVTGEYSYDQFADGSTDVEDGNTVTIVINSDAAGDSILGKNIVGVRAMLTFTESNEEQNGIGCANPTVQGPQDDDVSGEVMHDEYSNSAQVISGDYVQVEWHNSSIVGTNVTNMSEADIEMELDGDGIGFGEHSLAITVNVNTGGGPGCQSNDPGENVSYVVELISLEYDIEAID